MHKLEYVFRKIFFFWLIIRLVWNCQKTSPCCTRGSKPILSFIFVIIHLHLKSFQLLFLVRKAGIFRYFYFSGQKSYWWTPNFQEFEQNSAQKQKSFLSVEKISWKLKKTFNCDFIGIVPQCRRDFWEKASKRKGVQIRRPFLRPHVRHCWRANLGAYKSASSLDTFLTNKAIAIGTLPLLHVGLLDSSFQSFMDHFEPDLILTL